MHLKLDSLQKLLDHTLVEERVASDLRAEVQRVLGPVVVTDVRLHEVASAANDRLDVLDRTGRTGSLMWTPKVVMRWTRHSDAEVRKLAARTVPVRCLASMSSDRDPAVRAHVARRAPMSLVKEMAHRFPADDGLRTVVRQRMLSEAGVKNPKRVPMGHESIPKERMGDNSRTFNVPDLTETWYKEQAQRLFYEYGGKMECSWEESAVRRFCSSSLTTSGIEIDEEKLLKSVKNLIKEKEDMVMERDALRETLAWLDRQDELEALEENAIPAYQERKDPVADLVYGALTGEAFLREAARVFRVQESVMPLGIRKYRLGEGNARQTMVPCVGLLPHDGGFRSLDERALDVFCETWSRQQRLQGEPLTIQWSAHPSEVGKVSFTCSLR